MKYLGVDFGLKRVGLAISEGELASPLKVIEGRSLTDLSLKVSQLALNEGFEKVIVGMPEGDTGEATKKFIELLRKSGLAVEESDETLSTQDAIKLMVQLGKGKNARKINDAHSAAIILQNYLDSDKYSEGNK